MGRKAARVGLALSAAVTLAGLAMIPGCGVPSVPGIQQLPLPGGADLGNYPFTVVAEFRDVVSLFPQSAVKVNDVAVGEVTKVELGRDGWTARVTMKVNGKVWLPQNTYANLEQSSLLGEKFIQLVPPGSMRSRPDLIDTQTGVNAAYSANRGRLRDGAVIPLIRTNRNPEIEEAFGALSLLLSGGGVEKIHTITTELNNALDGNQAPARSLLTQINTLAKNLDKNKEQITAAIDGMNRLSSTLAQRGPGIGQAIDGLPEGLKVLRDQRGALVTMLRSLNSLSGVAVDTLDRSKKDLVADLKALEPILRNLDEAGQDLPDSLQVMFTYPFTDEVLSGVKGDYLNVYLNMAAAPGSTELIGPITDATETQRSAGQLPVLPGLSGSGTTIIEGGGN
ncbi:MlaD family protein [Streptomyces polyrhachis]|uniref:MlaD family protein n=1 Tax=Streptomyces polyrhachis TaxID=1282885 RepID=A0ABW2GI72_9ACTN